MNKLLVITVLVAFLTLSAESFRVPRQVDEEEGTLTKITNRVRSYYDSTINTASGYLDSIRGLKLEEKAKNFFEDTSKVVTTYADIVQDQIYHIIYSKQ